MRCRRPGMSAIFVSYRRDGALVHARAVFERLSREFGVGQVFIDLEGIDFGVDFVDLIETQLQGCQVMLALIDPGWATATDRQGRLRLDKANDFVRIEITAALKRGIRVMPILIDAADMPDADTLPVDLKPLVRRHALALDFRRFDAEIGRLGAAIRRVLEGSAKATESATEKSTLTASRPPGTVFRDGTDCPDMVVIPGGSFMMGSPKDESGRCADEGPQRRVTLTSFALGRTPVTQGQWNALMGSNRGHFNAGGDDFLPTNADWNHAQAYVLALSASTGERYCLPSEARWEYAARAWTTTPYYTGHTITPAQANFRAMSPVNVGCFPANGFGLYDMLGNCFEWVQDCYDAKAYGGAAPSDGSAHETADCASRVLRSGPFGWPAAALRAAARREAWPGENRPGTGFRVCRVFPVE